MYATCLKNEPCATHRDVCPFGFRALRSALGSPRFPLCLSALRHPAFSSNTGLPRNATATLEFDSRSEQKTLLLEELKTFLETL